ncbi:MAG: DUF4190 domain-containing protein [Chloroflexota bacterium]
MNDYPQSGGYPPATLPTSTLALISMIAGVLGFTLFPTLGSIIAIITGNMARKETRGFPPTHSGDGMATAGIIMGWIGVGLAVVGICCVIAYFVFFAGLIGTQAFQ